jgi:RluA family pseudouridine synthase
MDRKSDQYIYLVSKKDEGKNLVIYLRQRLGISGKKIKRSIEKGGCILNGLIERFGSVRLKTGDRIYLLKDKLCQPCPSLPLSLSILFEDEHLLFCNKPAGLVASHLRFTSLLQCPVFPVHRLDRETSGVMVVAKTKQMQELLEDLFRRRKIKKSYFALVKGKVKQDRGEMRNFLIEKKRYDGQVIWGQGRQGAFALTSWRKISGSEDKTLLECMPKTGRTHQLRVHLSGMGHPILGDCQYGRSQPAVAMYGRLFLHAHTLSFIHPFKYKRVHITAPLPEAFLSICKNFIG